MTSALRRTSITAMLLLGFTLLAAGCGGGGDDESSTAETSHPQAASGGSGSGGSGPAALQIKMSDFSFKPGNPTAKPGATTITAPNVGSVEHELVLFRTDMNPAKLPTEANGGVDEEKLDKIAEEAGEIADVEPGDSKSEEFDLKPGHYVMFCNVPGHYAQGMYGTLTVK